MDDPEFIVVGSGAGGGPLAAGLARKGHKVLLLEAGGDVCGGDIGKLMYEVPIFNALCTEYPECAWDFFVRHYDDLSRDQRNCKFDQEGGGIWYPRAGTLGGCSAHNAMIIVTPQTIDWDFIARLTGDWSWRADNMNRYFERLENCRYKPRPGSFLYGLRGLLWSALGLLRHDPDWRDWRHGHGFGGWLNTAEARPELILKDSVLTKLLLKVGEVITERRIGSLFDRAITDFDPNDKRNDENSPEGLALTPLSVLDGRRNGPREYLLSTAREHPGNLEIRLNTLVTRVIFADGAAVGVEALEGRSLYQADPRRAPDARGEPRTFRASKEVILCGGAFNSPQLLMLSGVGPRAELERHRIPVVADRPGVGANLQDRYEISVVSQFPDTFELLQGATFAPPEPGHDDPTFDLWRKGEGLYTSNGSLIGILKRSSPDLPEPDLYIFGLPADFRGYYRGYSKASERYKDRFTWVILKAYTNDAAGSVTLRSADPTERPAINFRSFGDGSDEERDDIHALLHGVNFVRQMNERLGVESAKEIVPGPQVAGEAAVRQFIEDQAWGHHASCSNKIGPPNDPMAVLDSHFRVRGVRNLRVVDASVFPKIPGYFIVTPVYMISEKAVDVISADYDPARPHRRPERVSARAHE
jgi:choline dehydrogenase